MLGRKLSTNTSMILTLTREDPGSGPSLKPFICRAHVWNFILPSSKATWFFHREGSIEAGSVTEAATDMAPVNQWRTQGLCPSAAALPDTLILGDSGIIPSSVLVPSWVTAAQLWVFQTWGLCFYSCFSLSWPSVVSLLCDFLPTATALRLLGYVPFTLTDTHTEKACNASSSSLSLANAPYPRSREHHSWYPLICSFSETQHSGRRLGGGDRDSLGISEQDKVLRCPLILFLISVVFRVLFVSPTLLCQCLIFFF